MEHEKREVWKAEDAHACGPGVLEKMPVCGNCHSFAADGQTMSMDVDFASDKGSYTIRPVSEEMFLCRDDIITWSDFRKEDKKKTFGLLSQVSPCGRVLSAGRFPAEQR